MTSTAKKTEPDESDNALTRPTSIRELRRYAIKALVWCIVLIMLDRALFYVLKTGYDRYFGMHQPCDLIFLGNSRTALGVDHRLITKQLDKRCGKFALNGATSQTRFAMIQYLCATQPQCSIVVMDVSAYTFNDKNLSTGAYTLLYPYMNADSIFSHVSTHSRKFGEVFLRNLFCGARFNSTTLNLAIRGLLGRDDNLKFSAVDLDQVTHRINSGQTQSLAVDPESLEVFDRSVKFLIDNQKQVVLLYLPVVKMLNDVDRQQHDANLKRLKQYAIDSPNVFFLDLNQDNEENYEIMFDGIHLNNKGKKQLSNQIAEFLDPVVNGN